MNTSTISICIPTFNRADLIGQTLKSVIQQTKKPYEVLIVDNASTDNTGEIVMRYKRYGIKYVRNKKNIGMMGNINKCVSLAKGEYLSILPSDDLISPRWCETWSKIIKIYKADIYTSSIVVVDKNNKPVFVGHSFNKNKMIKQPYAMEEFSKTSPIIAPTAATIYKKNIFKKIGLFDKKLGTEADVLFSLRMFLKSDIYYCNKILYAHRLHEQQSFDQFKEKKTIQSQLVKLDNYFNILFTFFKDNYDIKRRSYIIHSLSLALVTINLYLFKFQFKKVFGSYLLIRKYFPDAFTHIDDWIILAKTQFLYLWKVIFDRYLLGKDKKQLTWLKSFQK